MSAATAIPAWLPNAITVLRIALIPAFVMHAHWCAEASGGGDPTHRFFATAALIGIGVSDVVDGFLARRYGLTSKLGANLDAFADKLAQVCLLVFFFVVEGDAFFRIPLWFLAGIVGRDLLLVAGSLLVRARRGRVETEHRFHGKAASLLLFVFILWITIDVGRSAIGGGMLVVAAGVAFSTIEYVRDGWRQWSSLPDRGR